MICNALDLLPPKIITTKEQSSVTFVIGETSAQRLNCSTIGEPPPQFRWFKDGIVRFKHCQNNDSVSLFIIIYVMQPIQNSSDYDKTQITVGSNGESFLEFLDVDENTQLSEYVCIAENILENDSLTFKLEIIGMRF